MTRSMTTKQNENAHNRKRSKNINNDGGSATWSHMIPDILFSIVMRLGVIDFVSFGCVCKTWRAAMLSHRDMFMMSRRPMAMRISTQVAKRRECLLEDSEGRKFKTILPRTSGRIYLGLFSGYLIFFRGKTRDFKLVNLITRHELHFPRCPYHVAACIETFVGTLVNLPRTSRWLLVISAKFSRSISFSLAGKKESWTHLYSDLPIYDLQFFQGKIYAMNTKVQLSELRLYPKTTLTLLNMKNLAGSHVILPALTSSGENLFITGYGPENQCSYVEADFKQMKWVTSVAFKEYEGFISILKFGVMKHEFWKEPHTGFARSDPKKCFAAITYEWYFPHKSVEVNHLHLELIQIFENLQTLV